MGWVDQAGGVGGARLIEATETGSAVVVFRCQAMVWGAGIEAFAAASSRRSPTISAMLSLAASWWGCRVRAARAGFEGGLALGWVAGYQPRYPGPETP